MGIEVNLMQNYPYSQRDISGRLESKTQHDKLIAMEFGQEFFDGSRNHGYGGFSYNSRFWKNVVPDFIQHWQLKNGDSLLDIGCAKGFMLYDLKEYLPNLDVYGVDISEYAINNAKEEVRDFCQVANAISLPFDDQSIDISISICLLYTSPSPRD